MYEPLHLFLFFSVSDQILLFISLNVQITGAFIYHSGTKNVLIFFYFSNMYYFLLFYLQLIYMQ